MNLRTRTITAALFFATAWPAVAAEFFSPADALNLRRVTAAEISPDGTWAACLVSVPRAANEESGSAWSELHLVSTDTGEIRRFLTGKVNVGSPQWSPNGKFIAFTMARGKDSKTQVWIIPVDGGEALELTSSQSSVLSFRWDPAGKRIGYIAQTPQTEKEKDLEKKGYGFTFYEENLKDRNLYVVDVTGYG